MINLSSIPRVRILKQWKADILIGAAHLTCRLTKCCIYIVQALTSGPLLDQYQDLQLGPHREEHILECAVINVIYLDAFNRHLCDTSMHLVFQFPCQTFVDRLRKFCSHRFIEQKGRGRTATIPHKRNGILGIRNSFCTFLAKFHQNAFIGRIR